jgi:hypothetical protein
MPNRSKDDLIAAHHEAGHAVGAFLLGVPFATVTIADPGSGEGSVRAPLTIGEIRERNLRWECAVVAMLGRATERLVFGRADRRYLQKDAETIARLYCTSKLGFAAEMSCQEFRAGLRSRTAEVIERPGFREAVEVLTRVLMEEGKVEGERAAEIIRRTITSFGAA